jgi:predicted patatin/cPLA2 family phospholipase
MSSQSNNGMLCQMPSSWIRGGRAQDDSFARPTLHPARVDAMRRMPDDVVSPVLRLVLERARTGSRPGGRTDGQLVCLAIEGGGMRGAVSAGMCVVLEAAGLTCAFDRIYGVSAGALNGWGMAAGQAALGSTHYQDAASLGVINRMQPLVRRPVIDYDLLFGELIAMRKPLSFARLAFGPEFRALAVSPEAMSLRVLHGFVDFDEVLRAVRASASLPRLGGELPVFRGERMADGGLVEPIPFQTALREGATRVLVLRSRPCVYRQPALGAIGQSLALRDNPALADLIRARPGIYNGQAEQLEIGPGERRDGAHVHQIAPPDHTRTINRLESNCEHVTEALQIGARAAATAILTEPIDLCRQPVVYRAATSAETSTTQPIGEQGMAVGDVAARAVG